MQPEAEETFLIPLHTDLRIRKLVERPLVIWGGGETTIIEKGFIVCDACNGPVAISDEEVENEGLPIGYAVCDREAIFEVVCEECRNKYFSGNSVFNTLEEAGL